MWRLQRIRSTILALAMELKLVASPRCIATIGNGDAETI
jgi:hypothetical protein